MKTTHTPNTTFLTPIAGLALAAALACIPTAADAALIHDYQFSGNLNDAQGGPALISAGGTVGATAYSFGANQGLSLLGTGLGDQGNYTIEMRVSLDQVISSFGSRWIKLIDFENLSDDAGLYSFDGQLDGVGSILQFFPDGGTTDAFSPGQYTHIAITRNSATKETIAYAQGLGAFVFTDTLDNAVFSSDIIRFMIDDFPTTQREAGPGRLDYLRIYDSVLSPQEIFNIAVPEPTTALFGLATGAVILLRRRRAAVR